jgi:hydrogenase expression/formation protein HypC
MCLAIPAKIESYDPDTFTGVVDILGVKREASFTLTPDAKVGEYALIHAGFAIEMIDEESARETLELINELPGMADLEQDNELYEASLLNR